MNTFDFIEKINQLFGKNSLAGTPEQQNINVKIAQLLTEYRESLTKGKRKE